MYIPYGHPKFYNGGKTGSQQNSNRRRNICVCCKYYIFDCDFVPQAFLFDRKRMKTGIPDVASAGSAALLLRILLLTG